MECITSVAQYANTTFWKEDPNEQGFFYEWLVHVSADPNPPHVLSMSYDLLESDPRYKEFGYDVKFNLEAQKLGVRGVTVVVASGDDGAAGYEARSNKKLCGLNPSFPSSSPWVTSVGATMGPEHAAGKDRTEVACTSDGQGLITSGGGFSNRFARPDYQKSAVQGFLDASKAAGTLPPAGTFNATGRGYVKAKTGGESCGG